MGNIVDISLAIIFLIAIIVGVIKGFSKEFSKGLCGFIAFFGSIGLVVLLMPLLKSTNIFKQLAEAAGGWFSKEYYTTAIASAEDLIAVLEQSFLKILQSISDKMFNAMQSVGATTLGAYFGHLTASFIVSFFLWIILLLALKYSLLGIKCLLGKIAKLPVLRTLDRIFGLVWSVAITYLIVISLVLTTCEIVIIKFIPNFQSTLMQLVADSILFKFAHNTNLIGSYVAQFFNIDLLNLAVIA